MLPFQSKQLSPVDDILQFESIRLIHRHFPPREEWYYFYLQEKVIGSLRVDSLGTTYIQVSDCYENKGLDFYLFWFSLTENLKKGLRLEITFDIHKDSSRLVKSTHKKIYFNHFSKEIFSIYYFCQDQGDYNTTSVHYRFKKNCLYYLKLLEKHLDLKKRMLQKGYLKGYALLKGSISFLEQLTNQWQHFNSIYPTWYEDEFKFRYSPAVSLEGSLVIKESQDSFEQLMSSHLKFFQYNFLLNDLSFLYPQRIKSMRKKAQLYFKNEDPPPSSTSFFPWSSFFPEVPHLSSRFHLLVQERKGEILFFGLQDHTQKNLWLRLPPDNKNIQTLTESFLKMNKHLIHNWSSFIRTQNTFTNTITWQYQEHHVWKKIHLIRPLIPKTFKNNKTLSLNKPHLTQTKQTLHSSFDPPAFSFTSHHSNLSLIGA